LLSADTFIGRFLQHVLPKGFVKVRYYGLFRMGNRHLLAQARATLAPALSIQEAPLASPATQAESATPSVLCCPACGQPMQLVQSIPRRSRAPPAAVQRRKHWYGHTGTYGVPGASYGLHSAHGQAEPAGRVEQRMQQLAKAIRSPSPGPFCHCDNVMEAHQCGELGLANDRPRCKCQRARRAALRSARIMWRLRATSILSSLCEPFVKGNDRAT
jgi:hypothetical protein